MGMMWRPIEIRVGDRDGEWERRENVQEKRGGEGERRRRCGSSGAWQRETVGS